MVNWFSDSSSVGKVASLYVLAVIFTGAAFIAGYDYLSGIALAPVISTILGASLSFAIQTLGFHMAAQQNNLASNQPKEASPPVIS